MDENTIAEKVLDAAFRIHRQLGPGLLESVYEIVLVRELERMGLNAERQKPIQVRFEDLIFDEAFRVDLLVEGRVIVEIKSVEKLMPVHGKQVLTYLRLTGLQLGLLINFGENLLKDGVKRVVNGLKDT
ncbi:MAG: GxxExxY protein [Opitutales bacterium]